jgi:NADH-quinone oxidoreductase subunit C
VPNIGPDELRERFTRDLPGALAPERPKVKAPENGHAAEPPARGKKVEEGPADLLATNDVVVMAERIPEVAQYMRDELGYTFLTDITAVDYLADGVIEVIYRFLHLDGGPTVPIKTRVPRERAVVPSITPFWPGASLQEREAFDLYGVDFPGHPSLTRVYMWDEFEGFPMRKDFPKQGDKYLGDEEE